MKQKMVLDLYTAMTDETPKELELRAMRAQRDGLSAIEACAELIDFYNPQGLGPHADFFTMGKIRIYKEGTKEATEAKEEKENKAVTIDGSFFEGRT